MALHSFQFFKDLPIMEAKYAKTKIFQMLSAGTVIISLSGMDISVNFNHQISFGAEKIDDKTNYIVLTTKLESAQTMISQLAPKNHFGGRRLLAELASSFD